MENYAEEIPSRAGVLKIRVTHLKRWDVWRACLSHTDGCCGCITFSDHQSGAAAMAQISRLRERANNATPLWV